MRLRALLLLTALLTVIPAMGAEETVSAFMADGFDPPLGLVGPKQYYRARGFRPNGHLGEDWNGVRGGDTDLGDPVYNIAHGLVVFARNYKLGWGNVVIIRHAYLENGQTQFVDSLYGHLNEILVQEGQQAAKGLKIGTIGNTRGMYDAHLHFEMRKNIRVGMFRSSFPRDYSIYWDPSEFIAAHRTLAGAGTTAALPINTFPASAPPVVGAPMQAEAPLVKPSAVPVLRRGGSFKVDRYDDLR
ncbi:MAG: nlpD [Chthoniobacteraceae bacterium]|nr:nlpD [Chthoniobacteraceae bacterium]